MFSEPHNSHGQLEYCIAAMLTTTLVLCCRKQRSKVSLTNVTHQPHALHPPIPAHRLHKRQKGESTAPTMRITNNPAHNHRRNTRRRGRRGAPSEACRRRSGARDGRRRPCSRGRRRPWGRRKGHLKRNERETQGFR